MQCSRQFVSGMLFGTTASLVAVALLQSSEDGRRDPSGDRRAPPPPALGSASLAPHPHPPPPPPPVSLPPPPPPPQQAAAPAAGSGGSRPPPPPAGGARPALLPPTLCNATEGTCAPRCPKGLPPPAALGPAPRVWFAGCLPGPGGAKSGLNNQRHTVMAALILAEQLGATLILGDYAVNAHDRETVLSWDEIFDMPRLRGALRGGVFSLREAGNCIPESAGVVAMRAHWEGGHDMEELLRAMRAAGDDVELVSHHTTCGGHPFLRFRHSAPAQLARADDFLRRAVGFSPALVRQAEAVLQTLRSTAGSGQVHCLHIRVRYKADHMEFPFAPLLNCTEVFQKLGSNCDVPERPGCLCNPNTKQGQFTVQQVLAFASHPDPNKLLKEKERPTWLDFDWQVKQAVAEGLIKPGDTVYIATNDRKHLRIEFTLDELKKHHLRPVFAQDVGRLNPAAGRPLLTGSPVLASAVEQALCSIVPGRFYGSCLSSVSEMVSDVRRWGGDAAGARDHRVFIGLQSQPNLGALFQPLRCADRKVPKGFKQVRKRVSLNMLRRNASAALAQFGLGRRPPR